MALEPNSKSSWRSWLEVTATLLLACAALVIITAVAWDRFYSKPARTGSARRPEPRPPTDSLSIDGAAVRGSATAQVVLIEFSDFQCPYCAKFATETLRDIEKLYIRTGRVRLAFRHVPLPTHPLAMKAAEAA